LEELLNQQALFFFGLPFFSISHNRSVIAAFHNPKNMYKALANLNVLYFHVQRIFYIVRSYDKGLLITKSRYCPLTHGCHKNATVVAEKP